MYILSFLQCSNYIVVCDQIANKSFVQLNASILGEYREKPSLQSASHAGRQDSVSGGEGGHKQIFGGHKRFNTSNPRAWTKKKLFISKYARIFTNSGVKPQKKRIFITKSAKKQCLLTNSGVITSILGVSGLELHFSVTEPVTFFWAQSSLGGHSFVWGAQAVIWGGYGPGMHLVPSGLLQVYSNLSNCNYRIFVKEIPLEIDFVEEMRTI